MNFTAYKLHLNKLQLHSLSHVRLFATPWTVAHQASLSMGFSRQEYWSGLPFPSPGDLPKLGIEPGSPVLQTVSLPFELNWEAHELIYGLHYVEIYSLYTNIVEKEMATHSSILAWRIPWTKKPGGLQSMGLQRVGHD